VWHPSIVVHDGETSPDEALDPRTTFHVDPDASGDRGGPGNRTSTLTAAVVAPEMFAQEAGGVYVYGALSADRDG